VHRRKKSRKENKILEKQSGLPEATNDLQMEEEMKEEDVNDILNELYYSKKDKEETHI
jgi:hypothetical protein